MPVPGRPTLVEARRELARRLAHLGAPAEVVDLVNKTAYDLRQLAREDRPLVAVIHPVLEFVGERGNSGDLELAAGYTTAVCELAAQFAIQRTQLEGLREDVRRRRVRGEEQRKLLPPPDEIEPDARPIGPDGTEVPYGVARERRPTDGPDAHYLRDYYWRVERDGRPGILSLPCVACEGRHASDPCSGCSVPGGRCSADWWVPTPPGVLGPHWPALSQAYRFVYGRVSAVHGKRGAEKARELGKQTGRPKAADEDTIAEVVRLVAEKGESQALTVLIEDRQYPRDEAARLVREGKRRLDRA